MAGTTKNESIKQQTLALYDSLPQEEELRKCRIDVRDKVIELNYTFFGYIAKRTYVSNTSVSYEDKFQSALCCFMNCWWWFKWAKKYRTDLSFTSFFTLRLGEMVERDLSDIKYSLRRTLCMDAGKQLGKHWAKVKYDDLANVTLPIDKMNSLKAIFGAVYWADLSEHEAFIESPDNPATDISRYLSDKYNTIEGLLIHEMVLNEAPLTDDDLLNLAEMHSLDYWELRSTLPKAMEKLHQLLLHNQENSIL